MDLGAMTVSLRADLSGLDAGLKRAQELVARSAAALARQEERFCSAGVAARDYGEGASRCLSGAAGAVDALGTSAEGLERRWAAAWDAMDSAADVALRRMTRRFGRSVAAMIVDGRGLRDFWRGLWRDLLEIAVQRLMQMVLETRGAAGAMREALGLVGGGLGGLLGGVFGGIGKIFGFDNPVNDAWARRQGFDFGRHFRAGVAAAMAAPATLGPGPALAAMGSVTNAPRGSVSIAPGAFQVSINAQTLDERAVRDAGALIADEVSRRLGWDDRRTG